MKRRAMKHKPIILIALYCIIINFLFFFAYTVIWGVVPLIAFVWLVGTLIEKGEF
jgi:fatty acid desaturase